MNVCTHKTPYNYSLGYHNSLSNPMRYTKASDLRNKPGHSLNLRILSNNTSSISNGSNHSSYQKNLTGIKNAFLWTPLNGHIEGLFNRHQIKANFMNLLTQKATMNLT